MRFFKIIIAVAVCGGLVIWQLLGGTISDGLLHVDFLNIGQGDASLIRTSSGESILIDGGPGSSVVRELQETLPSSQKNIDIVIATHGDKDHIEGLISVLQRYQVGTLYTSGMQGNSLCTRLLRAARSRGTKIIFADQNSDIIFHDGSKLDFLYPFHKEIDAVDGHTNDASIVTRYDAGEHSFLFTGDMPSTVEKLLIKKHVPLDVDILKVGHHGSKLSTSDDFLKEVTPEISVISVGKKNNYNHPHPDLMTRLKKIHTRILRTDQIGRISFSFNPSHVGSK